MAGSGVPVCVQRDELSGPGLVVVMDGLGSHNQVVVQPNETKAFPVRLDGDGCLYWRFDDEEGDRMEAFPVIRVLRPSSTEVAYLEVARSGPDVVWSYYEQQPGSAAASAPVRNASAEGLPQGKRAAPVGAAVPPEAYAKAALGLTQEFLNYVGEAPTRLSALCCVGGVAMVLTSILSVLNIFGALDHLIYYICSCYTLFFGLVTCVNELEHEMAPEVHRTLFEIKKWMREWAKGLTTLWGRGLFYFFQGTVALCGSTTGRLGQVVGIYMMVMGAACINLHLRGPVPPEEAYVRIVD